MVLLYFGIISFGEAKSPPRRSSEGSTPLSFGFDLQGLLMEALDLPLFYNKRMDPHGQRRTSLTEKKYSSGMTDDSRSEHMMPVRGAAIKTGI